MTHEEYRAAFTRLTSELPLVTESGVEIEIVRRNVWMDLAIIVHTKTTQKDINDSWNTIQEYSKLLDTFLGPPIYDGRGGLLFGMWLGHRRRNASYSDIARRMNYIIAQTLYESLTSGWEEKRDEAISIMTDLAITKDDAREYAETAIENFRAGRIAFLPDTPIDKSRVRERIREYERLNADFLARITVKDEDEWGWEKPAESSHSHDPHTRL